MWNMVLKEIYKVDSEAFFFFFNFNFWISLFWRHGLILHEVRDIFLPGCHQVLSMLNLRSKGISEPHKISIQKRESYFTHTHTHI